MERQNREYNDEINIYDLWKVIVKRKKLIIGLFLLAVISTAIASLFMPKIYRGEVKLHIINITENTSLSTIRSNNDISTLDAKKIVDSLGTIDDEKKKLILPKTYISVKSVKLRVLNDTKKIVATIDTKSTDDIPVAMSELADFLNDMECVKENLNAERERLTQNSIELSHLLKKAQELAVAYDKLIQEGKFAAIGINPLELNKDIVNFKNEKFAADQSLSRLKKGRIQIVTPPSISNDPVSPRKISNVILAGMLGLLLGLFLAFFIEYIGNIKDKKSKPADNDLTH